MPEPTVLRYQVGDPAPPCPACGVKVIGVETMPETIWVLKDEFQGAPGLPVGFEYGREVPIRVITTLRPCGHEVDEIQITGRPKPPDPLSFIVVDGLYESTTKCTRCGESFLGVEHVTTTLAEMVEAANTHLKTCDKEKP